MELWISAALGIGVVALAIEHTPPDWRKAIGGAVLLIALATGCVFDRL